MNDKLIMPTLEFELCQIVDRKSAEAVLHKRIINEVIQKC
jgi:hypothetical protein